MEAIRIGARVGVGWRRDGAGSWVEEWYSISHYTIGEILVEHRRVREVERMYARVCGI